MKNRSNNSAPKLSLDTRTILIIVICLSTLSVLRQTLPVQLLVLGITILLLTLRIGSKDSLIILLTRLKKLIPVIISLAVMQLIFRREGTIYFEFYLLQITEAGLFYSLSVGLRLINLILIAGLLFNIPTAEYLIVFKTWKIPYEISFLVTSIIRFIPDYYALFGKYRETLLLRGISVSKLSVKNKFRAVTVLVRTALVDSLHGLNYRAISLDMKGFRAFPKRTYLYDINLPKIELYLQVVVIITTIVVIGLI